MADKENEKPLESTVEEKPLNKEDPECNKNQIGPKITYFKDVDQKPLELNVEENPLNKVQQVLYKNKTFGEKISYIRDNITVEPLLAGLIVPSIISRFAMGNLNLDKACRVNLQFGDEVCDALITRESNNFSSYEREVQKLISSIDIWKGIIQTLIPCILIMFIGAWSDRTGKRKFIILMPIFGEFITSLNNIVNVYFFYEIPVQMTVFLETIFPACTGGWVTMFLGVFAYITDITTEEARTFRVGLVNFCMTVGVPVGISLSGILLKMFGYYAIFATTSVMFLLILLYGFFCLKEPEQLLVEKGFPVVSFTSKLLINVLKLYLSKKYDILTVKSIL